MPVEGHIPYYIKRVQEEAQFLRAVNRYGLSLITNSSPLLRNYGQKFTLEKQNYCEKKSQMQKISKVLFERVTMFKYFTRKIIK